MPYRRRERKYWFDGRYYYGIQVHRWRNQVIARLVRPEWRLYELRRAEGRNSVKGELLSAAYRCILKLVKMTKKILDRIPTLQWQRANNNFKKE